MASSTGACPDDLLGRENSPGLMRNWRKTFFALKPAPTTIISSQDALDWYFGFGGCYYDGEYWQRGWNIDLIISLRFEKISLYLVRLGRASCLWCFGRYNICYEHAKALARCG